MRPLRFFSFSQRVGKDITDLLTGSIIMYSRKENREIFLTCFFKTAAAIFFFFIKLQILLLYANFAAMENNRTTLLNSLHMMTHSAATAALWVLVFTLALLFSSCGGGNEFRINGEIENFGTGNLRLVFYSRDAVRSVTATAVDGKFMAISHSPRPTVVRFYNSPGKLIGSVIIENGQTVEVKFDAADPTAMTVSGNRESERLAQFLKENSQAIKNNDTPAINSAVEEIVEKNPKWMLSGMLMTDYYDSRPDPQKALAMIASMQPEVVRDMQLAPLRQQILPLALSVDSLSIPAITLFTQDDTLRTFSTSDNTNTLLMFTKAEHRESDSINDALTDLTSPESTRTIAIIDISADPDTAAWHKSIGGLSFTSPSLTHTWSLSPATITGIEPIPLSSYPWFILTDSTGTPLYSGPSISAVRNLIDD